MASLSEQLEAVTRRTVGAAGPRYSPALDPAAPNIEIGELVSAVSALALGARAQLEVRHHATALRQAVKSAEHTIHQMLSGIRITPVVVADDLDRLADQWASGAVRRNMSTLRRHMRVLRLSLERRQAGIEARLSHIRDRPADQVSDAEKRERETLQFSARDLREVWSALREIQDWVSGSQGQLLAERHCALLLGPWGSGKTHFVCDFALAAAKDGVPAIAVLASGLRDDLSPLDAISAATGIGTDGADLAAKLDRAARRAGRRALIMIDAINEADRSAWRRRLPDLVSTIGDFEHLGLVLTCRTPFDRAIVTTTAAGHLVFLQHRGFEDQELDAQQEFFAHYGLRAPHVPLITPEFSRPLFLRLLCEAVARLSRSSQHRQLNDVASGQKGMTFVLEHFAKSVGQTVEGLHSLKGLACWKLMKGELGKGHLGFAGRMAEHGRDFLWPSEAVDEIVTQTGLPLAAAESLAAEMVSEGLMSEDMRYCDGSYQTVLVFPYQRFADHLIARHLLHRHLDTRSEATVRRSFYSDRRLGSVFQVGGWGKQYAEPGIASAIMLEFPERVKRLQLSTSELIFYLPKARRLLEPFVHAFLDGLYWRGSSAITLDTGSVVDRLLGLDTKWITDETFETLIGLAVRPAHPFNAERLWQRVAAMPMARRDLTWSETLRRSSARSNLRRLISWAERDSRPATSESVAVNEMRVLALAGC